MVPLANAKKSAVLMTRAVVGSFGGSTVWGQVPLRDENTILKISNSRGKVLFEKDWWSYGVWAGNPRRGDY